MQQYRNALMLLPSDNPARKRGLAELDARGYATNLAVYGQDAQFWDAAAGKAGPAALQYLGKGLSEFDLYRIYTEQKEDLAQATVTFTGSDLESGGKACTITWKDDADSDLRKYVRDMAWNALVRTNESLHDDIDAMAKNCPSEMLAKERAAERMVTAALTHITRWRRSEGCDYDFAVAIREETDAFLPYIKEQPQSEPEPGPHPLPDDLADEGGTFEDLPL